ncbi:MAG TPA: hypothetical protein VFN48_09350 [Solirubrobacteraceae bacterium]|nr:hypothetical protein [Solirubrobacteraceae bacterium]
MSLAKLAVVGGLVAVTVGVSACGIQAQPTAGTVHLDRVPGNHSLVNDPRQPYLKCLRQAGLSFTKFDDGTQQLRSLQVNTRPAGPTIVFEPTPGIAEGDQMKGQEEGAEVIGSALIYPNHASDGLMQAVETCLATNVKG